MDWIIANATCVHPTNLSNLMPIKHKHRGWGLSGLARPLRTVEGCLHLCQDCKLSVSTLLPAYLPTRNSHRPGNTSCSAVPGCLTLSKTLPLAKPCLSHFQNEASDRISALWLLMSIRRDSTALLTGSVCSKCWLSCYRYYLFHCYLCVKLILTSSANTQSVLCCQNKFNHLRLDIISD